MPWYIYNRFCLQSFIHATHDLSVPLNSCRERVFCFNFEFLFSVYPDEDSETQNKVNQAFDYLNGLKHRPDLLLSCDSWIFFRSRKKLYSTNTEESSQYKANYTSLKDHSLHICRDQYRNNQITQLQFKEIFFISLLS